MLRSGASVKPMKKLSTTSYVILGLLSLKPWTSYELARQMRRSIRFYWPRAESGIYEEPKKLVAHGLATARTEVTGRRARTLYEITPAGHAALREWLATPGGMPMVEFDGILRVLFADQGGRESALSAVREIRDQARAARADHEALEADLRATGGPFPERTHINLVVLRWMYEQVDAVIRWADWAEVEIGRWG